MRVGERLEEPSGHKVRRERQGSLDRGVLDRSTDGNALGKATEEFQRKAAPQRRPLPLGILDHPRLRVLLCLGFWVADVHTTTYLYSVR